MPRKNLRQLSGVPIIGHVIRSILASKHAPTVVVSSDDPEILQIASIFGARQHLRDPALADAITTLDPVVHAALTATEHEQGVCFDTVVTVQPTSPLLTTASFDGALDQFNASPGVDTLISARNDTHLGWKLEKGRYVPTYKERLNRQQLPPTFRETGAFLMTRRNCVRPENRIGKTIDLFLLEPPESIDIDTHDDFALCQYFLNRRHIVFAVTGHRQVGLGHIHRVLALASHLVDHQLTFFVDAKSDLGAQKILDNNYVVARPMSSDWVADVLALRPDLVVNDLLDTQHDDMLRLRQADVSLINFEDLGSGALIADYVVNDLYPHPDQPMSRDKRNIAFGPRYFCARDEFRFASPKKHSNKIARVLVTFGGTDPSGLTEKVLSAIAPICLTNGIGLKVILGYGIAQPERFDRWKDSVELLRDVRNMAAHMLEADLAFTSAGRTVFELASLAIPGIVLAQNKRETTHCLAASGNGLFYMGLGNQIPTDEISALFHLLATDSEAYQRLCKETNPALFQDGTDRVVSIIREVLAEREMTHRTIMREQFRSALARKMSS